jgi:hypothetical protein
MNTINKSSDPKDPSTHSRAIGNASRPLSPAFPFPLRHLSDLAQTQRVSRYFMPASTMVAGQTTEAEATAWFTDAEAYLESVMGLEGWPRDLALGGIVNEITWGRTEIRGLCETKHRRVVLTELGGSRIRDLHGQCRAAVLIATEALTGDGGPPTLIGLPAGEGTDGCPAASRWLASQDETDDGGPMTRMSGFNAAETSDWRTDRTITPDEADDGEQSTRMDFPRSRESPNHTRDATRESVPDTLLPPSESSARPGRSLRRMSWTWARNHIGRKRT